jgi:hypothetical protein
MSGEAVHHRVAGWAQGQRLGLGAGIAGALLVALLFWLVLEATNSSPRSEAQTTNVTASSSADLERIAQSIDHWVFWVGPKKGYSYQLSRLSDGTVTIRYLPPGVRASDQTPTLTVGTYPFLNPYLSLQTLAKSSGSAATSLSVPGAGVGVSFTSNPKTVYVGYPGLDNQIVLFDPAGAARELVTSGQLAPVTGSQSSSQRSPSTPRTNSQPGPAALSLAGLRALPGSLGHAVYWVGPRAGYMYEVTRRPSGEVDLRYLPPGVAAGSPQAYLTVATYPFKRALQALQSLVGQKDEVPLPLPGGGLALLDSKHPTSIHLAYPGVDSQIEVYSPSPSVVRSLVASGRVRAVR